MSESDNYLEAMCAPVACTIPGVGDISFPICETDDFAPWCAEIHTARKAYAEKRIPKITQDPQAQLDMYLAVEHDAPGLDAVAKQVYTTAGARKVLVLSLTRHIPRTETDALAKARSEAMAKVRKIPGRELVNIAQKASGLFTFKQPEPKPDPNAVAAPEETTTDELPDAETGI